jgi:hypothetical protein
MVRTIYEEEEEEEEATGSWAAWGCIRGREGGYLRWKQDCSQAASKRACRSSNCPGHLTVVVAVAGGGCGVGGVGVG